MKYYFQASGPFWKLLTFPPLQIREAVSQRLLCLPPPAPHFEEETFPHLLGWETASLGRVQKSSSIALLLPDSISALSCELLGAETGLGSLGSNLLSSETEGPPQEVS